MKETVKRSNLPHGLLLLVLASALAWSGWWLWIRFAYGVPATAGELGDSFGGINALFSALAFAGVIYAIVLQRRELRLQRLELTATRGELAGQKAQMEISNAMLLTQSFENTFYQNVRLHHDIVEGMVYVRPSGGRPLEG